MYIVYRLENIHDHLGPWNSDNSPFFGSWEGSLFTPCYNKNPNYPGLKTDFKLYDENFDDDYVSGLHLPCLFFWWFGFDLDIFTQFRVYKIIVKDRIIGESGLQCFYKQSDVLKKEVLISFNHLKEITYEHHKQPNTSQALSEVK